MLEIRQTDAFAEWLAGLTDARSKAKVLSRIERLADGNPGDVEPVGDGVSEMRVHHGPGYRVYFQQRGRDLVLLLAGGDKSSQKRDIVKAKKLAREYED
ncbi:MAG: addiction module antitoxin RelB [Hyphomicrobium sp.]|nr:MAG: addiction module antitoxin RelB [Hyphomicrobium sp.]